MTLSAQTRALIEGPVGAFAASAGLDGEPRMARVLGCTTTDESVTVYVSARQAPLLLRAVSESGRVAAVFSLPRDYTTVQIKGDGAELHPADAVGRAVGEAYRAAFLAEVATVGVPAELCVPLWAEDLVAITFRPREAFGQTPGPGAGEALETSP